jgi:hypothetical protein
MSVNGKVDVKGVVYTPSSYPSSSSPSKSFVWPPCPESRQSVQGCKNQFKMRKTYNGKTRSHLVARPSPTMTLPSTADRI